MIRRVLPIALVLLAGCTDAISPRALLDPHVITIATLGLLFPLLLPRSKEPPPPRVQFKITHALPVTLQLIILTYWAIHYTPLRDYAWFIGFQVVYAYVVDALLGWRRHGRAQLTLAPLPVVLSTNLFVQFAPQTTLQLVIIAAAIVSKELFRRNGRHIFNPSAIAITLVGFVNLIFLPHLSGDVAGALESGPLMPFLILALALVVQSRVPVALISISAATVMMLAQFSVTWPANLLVFTLLATDPATTPRTAVGRVVYGGLIGGLFAAFTISMNHVGVTDFYGKVACVPVANLLVPAVDALARRLPQIEAALAPTRNRWHIALFASIILARAWLNP